VIVNEAEKWKWESEPEYSSEIKQSYLYPDSSDESEGEEDHKVIADDQEETIVPARPQRNRQAPVRLTDCEIKYDDAVNDEGEIAGKENMVYKLHKALYRLKQAPRARNKKIDQVLIQIGFKKCSVEFGVYV